MKRKILSLFGLAILAGFTSCVKKDEVSPKVVTVDKTAVFEVYAHKDYTNSYYADYEATIHLRIYRGDKGTMGEPLVFDTTFTKLLKDLPLEGNKLVIRKVVPDVDAQKEWVSLGSGYRVGAEAYGSYEPVPDGENNKKIKVVL